MELFTKLNKEEDATILMVTHDPFAASYCNRVIFIKDVGFTMNYTADYIARNFIKKYYMS